MPKFIPREKLSKKARRALDAEKRATWGFSPVTRRVESKKHYDRRKSAHVWKDDFGMSAFFRRGAVAPEAPAAPRGPRLLRRRFGSRPERRFPSAAPAAASNMERPASCMRLFPACSPRPPVQEAALAGPRSCYNLVIVTVAQVCARFLCYNDKNGSLRRALCPRRAVYGRVESGRRKTDAGWAFSVAALANCAADLTLPGGKAIAPEAGGDTF